jgi:hypothetical protein
LAGGVTVKPFQGAPPVEERLGLPTEADALEL